MAKRRVVVTGLGIVSPVGNDIATAWDNVVSGRSGITPITHFDASGFSTTFGGCIHDFDASQYIPAKDVRKMDPFIHFGVAAAEQAVTQSGVSVEAYAPPRIGVAMGSGIGGLGTIEINYQKYSSAGTPRKISPFFVPGSIINMIAGHVSIRYGFEGPNIALVTACTSATHCIGIAARIHQSGRAQFTLNLAKETKDR